MPLINKKNYITISCVVFTILVICKIVLEKIVGVKDQYYSENIMFIFLSTLVATAIIGLHYYLQNISLPVVIIGQYLVLVFITFFMVWINGHFVELDKNAYTQILKSFTVPYVILASYYYLSFYMDIRRANSLIIKIKNRRDAG